ncbi:MAG TPA: DUF58 domain-containing protein [Chthoniobacteraceae bacterium]|nr:DUF58 domain-containing protein [Chthoniobacteraceae bacterium]
MKTTSTRALPSTNLGGYLFVLGAMWYAGASQANGPAYLLFFLLLGVVLVSIPQAFANLRGLKVTPGSVKPVFAGQEAVLPVEIRNPSKRARHTVAVTLPGMDGDSQVVDEILPGEAEWTSIHFPAPVRGLHEIESTQLSSGWPIGAFIIRRRMLLRQSYLVYPAPAGSAEFPRTNTAAPKHRAEMVLVQGDDFNGVRSYLPGESQHHVDWKAVARGMPMMTKQFAMESGGALHFDYAALPMKEKEARLSQLALWIVQAERVRRPYSLRLPTAGIPMSLGDSHYHKCLQALALFP